nr:SOS response-associated peptidase [Chitinophagaceae bacterium]
MCYDVTSATKHKLKYAKHRREKLEDIAALEKELDKWIQDLPAMYHVNGFAHPELLVFTQDQPYQPQIMHWGLIPSWVKNKEQAKEIANQTLNARAETLLEKASFRQAVKQRRCVIYIDAFYEHHHLNKKTFPYHILMQDESPMAIAGLWDEWLDKETGEVSRTLSMITTQGNAMLAKIHNHPKASGPRMPVILPKDKQDEWLKEMTDDELLQCIQKLLVPFDENLLQSYTVRRLKGKDAIGNI